MTRTVIGYLWIGIFLVLAIGLGDPDRSATGLLPYVLIGLFWPVYVARLILRRDK
jgi:hypothetical protein